jgi:tetratricopeptide (TPR) repeat protein
MDIGSSLEQVRLLIKQGNKKEARSLLRKVAEKEPNNEHVYLLFAQVAEKREHVVLCLKRVIELNPKNEKAIYYLNKLGYSQDEIGGEETRQKNEAQRLSSDSSVVEASTPETHDKQSISPAETSPVSSKARQLSKGRYLVIIGGVLTAIAVALPWTETHVMRDQILSINPHTRGFESALGLIILLGSLILIASVVTYIIRNERVFSILPFAISLVLLIFVFPEIGRLEVCVGALRSIMAKYQTGGKYLDYNCIYQGQGVNWAVSGLFISLIGGIAVGIGGFRDRKHET